MGSHPAANPVAPSVRAKRPLVVGIVNVTPDSFSDGGLHFTRGDHGTGEKGLRHALRLASEGADWLDIGGESTRPGSDPVTEEVETSRVLPVIEGLRRAGVPIPLSIDTRKASVAEAALSAGASIVNDVSGATADPKMVETVAAKGAGIVLMHMKGEPRTMQDSPTYADVVLEVTDWLVRRAEAVVAAGVPKDRVWIDPGIGFGKTFAHNEEILRRLERFVATGWPVLVGASRKGFLGAITGRPSATDRLAASLACAIRAAEAGAAAVRVHDVAATVDCLATWERIGRVQ